MGNMKKEIYFFFFLNILTRGSACLKHATFIVVFAVEGGKGYFSDEYSRVVGPLQSSSVILKIRDWFRWGSLCILPLLMHMLTQISLLKERMHKMH